MTGALAGTEMFLLLAGMSLKAGDERGAERAFTNVRDLLRSRLRGTDPASEAWPVQAMVCQHLGYLAQRAGRAGDATTAFEEALDAARQTAGGSDAALDPATSLGPLLELAAARLREGRTAEAAPLLDALAQLTSSDALAPAAVLTAAALAVDNLEKASWRLAPIRESGLEMAATLFARCGSAPGACAPLGGLLLRVGEHAMGDHLDEAFTCLERAVALLRRAGEATSVREACLRALSFLGGAAYLLGRKDDARAAYVEAAQLAQALVASRPSSAKYRKHLATAADNAAKLCTGDERATWERVAAGASGPITRDEP